MSGKKVFEVARELNMKSKELLEVLRELGISATTHMSVLEESSIIALKTKINRKVEGTGKASDSFREIKGTPKTILIKKKAAVPAPEEASPTAAIIEAEPAQRGVDTIAGEKGVTEAEEEETRLEEKVVRKLKEFRELRGLKEELHADQAASATAAESIAAGVQTEAPAVIVLPQSDGSPAISAEPSVKVKPEEKAESKGQKKKGIKTIAGEVDEDLVIAHRWKSFKVIPKKVKKFKTAVADKKARVAQQADITKPRKKIIKLYEGVTVKEFADLIGHKSSEVIARLIEMGMMVPVNNPIDVDAAVLIADAFGLKVEVACEKKLSKRWRM